VHKLVESGKLTEDDVIEGAIGIEEASSKVVFLYQMPLGDEALKKIDKQLSDLKVHLSTERTASVSPTAQSKLQYAINNEAALRVKWNEEHIHIRANKRLRKFVDQKLLVHFVVELSEEVFAKLDSCVVYVGIVNLCRTRVFRRLCEPGRRTRRPVAPRATPGPAPDLQVGAGAPRKSKDRIGAAMQSSSKVRKN
jgi:hypothetical protein